MGDLKSLAPVLLDLMQCLLSDVARFLPGSYSAQESVRDFALIKRRVETEGVSFLTKCLPTFGRHLEHSLEFEAWTPVKGFAKRHRKGPLPRFLGGLVRLVFSESDGRLLSNPSSEAIAALRQVAYAFYKLELPFPEEVVAKAVDSYIRVDGSLPEPETPVSAFALRTRVILAGAAKLIESIFVDFDWREIKPRHGPGAVASGEKREEKWNFSTLYANLHAKYPYYEYFFACRAHFLSVGRAGWFRFQRKPSGVSRYTLVPKDSRGPRGISMEPLEYQYIQQGLFVALKDHIESHPLTRGRVNFTSQEVNQRLAKEASVHRGLATVDMKDASDRVSLWLVRTLFKGCPGLLGALEATRSAETQLPCGRILPLRKFAPMGSALCFPIEAIVFYALAVSVKALDRGISLEEACRLVYVYGDDIIVEPDVYEAMSRDFLVLGLRFNAKKSFFRGSFRESCGVDAFAGVDVTPVRFRRLRNLQTGATVGPEQVVSLVSNHNLLVEKGWQNTADYLAGYLRKHGFNPPYAPVGAAWGGLCLWRWSASTVGYSDGRLQRYDPALQRLEIKAPVVLPRVRPSRFTGWSALQQSLLQGGVPSLVPAGSSTRPPKEAKRKWIGSAYTM